MAWVATDKQLDHVGIVVRDPGIADRIALALGCEPDPPKILDDRGIRVIKLRLGSVTLEFISPERPGSEVEKFLQKKGPGLHHICLKTGNIDRDIRGFEKVGIRAIPGSRRAGAEGKDVVFFHPKDTGGILIELEAEDGGSDENK